MLLKTLIEEQKGKSIVYKGMEVGASCKDINQCSGLLNAKILLKVRKVILKSI